MEGDQNEVTEHEILLKPVTDNEGKMKYQIVETGKVVSTGDDTEGTSAPIYVGIGVWPADVDRECPNYKSLLRAIKVSSLQDFISLNNAQGLYRMLSGVSPVLTIIQNGEIVWNDNQIRADTNIYAGGSYGSKVKEIKEWISTHKDELKARKWRFFGFINDTYYTNDPFYVMYTNGPCAAPFDVVYDIEKDEILVYPDTNVSGY